MQFTHLNGSRLGRAGTTAYHWLSSLSLFFLDVCLLFLSFSECHLANDLPSPLCYFYPLSHPPGNRGKFKNKKPFVRFKCCCMFSLQRSSNLSWEPLWLLENSLRKTNGSGAGRRSTVSSGGRGAAWLPIDIFWKHSALQSHFHSLPIG